MSKEVSEHILYSWKDPAGVTHMESTWADNVIAIHGVEPLFEAPQMKTQRWKDNEVLRVEAKQEAIRKYIENNGEY